MKSSENRKTKIRSALADLDCEIERRRRRHRESKRT